jgi:hypothetical protein
MFERHDNIVIHQLLNRFEKGDMALLELIADDIDFRIDHYKDDADTSWQQCQNKEEFINVLTRLGVEIFPKGTMISGLTSVELKDCWYLTTFDQSFWYGLAEKDVTSRTYIISHELDGQLDYFRENVTSLQY